MTWILFFCTTTRQMGKILTHHRKNRIRCTHNISRVAFVVQCTHYCFCCLCFFIFLIVWLRFLDMECEHLNLYHPEQYQVKVHKLTKPLSPFKPCLGQEPVSHQVAKNLFTTLLQCLSHISSHTRRVQVSRGGRF